LLAAAVAAEQNQADMLLLVQTAVAAADIELETLKLVSEYTLLELAAAAAADMTLLATKEGPAEAHRLLEFHQPEVKAVDIMTRKISIT
jgi:hypothetical protein